MIWCHLLHNGSLRHWWNMINITLSGNAKLCLGLTELNSKHKAGQNKLTTV